MIKTKEIRNRLSRIRSQIEKAEYSLSKLMSDIDKDESSGSHKKINNKEE